jgi:iron complex transport system ATP-binding protein
VARALETTELTELVDRRLDELSEGQAQRAWLALVLAQQTEIVLLDEPTTFLDVAHQLGVLALRQPCGQPRGGQDIVTVLQDLNQAARYAHEMVAGQERGGRSTLTGSSTTAVVTSELSTISASLSAFTQARMR